MTNPWYYQSILTGEDQTDLSADKLTQLDSSDFLNVNQYVANGTCVPTNESELRTYLNIASDIVIPEVCNTMYPVYTSIKNNTLEYQQNIFPAVNTVTINLWGFTNDTIETLNTALDLLDKVRNNPTNTADVADLKEILLGLVKGDPKTGQGGAEDYSNQVKVVSQQLGDFITKTEADQVAVSRVHDSVESAIGGNSSEIQSLQADIESLNKTIAALNSTLKTYDTVSKWTLLIPFVGLVSNAVLSKFSDKQRAQLDAAQKALADDNAQIQRDNALNGLLQKLSTQSGTLADQAAQALQGLSKIKGTWDTMSDAINQIVKTEDKYFIDPTYNATLGVKLRVAVNSWTDIKGLVINFATAAHIKPPQAAATVGMLSTGPHEDVTFPILKVNLVG